MELRLKLSLESNSWFYSEIWHSWVKCRQDTREFSTKTLNIPNIISEIFTNAPQIRYQLIDGKYDVLVNSHHKFNYDVANFLFTFNHNKIQSVYRYHC